MSTKVQCVICEGDILISDGAMEGELFLCPDCGTELELISLNPPVLAEAPEVQEDWGE
ncbi:MAG: lysine biosynthesis protein LysW [Fretibacterium sp.]|nr:lysine biosynthesis protein LysW [Fretibacterium sp.]